MAEKKIRTNFDKVRLTLRIIGITCGAVPILSYIIFAFSFEGVQIIRNYELSEITIVKDLAYQLSAFFLPVANFGWTYLLPIFLPIAIFDIIVAVRRQMSNRLY